VRYLLMLLCLLVFAGSASAATPWKPGTPFYVTEDDMGNFLEKVYDSAYCQGIPRFGHRGEFPYEKFLYFDCSTERDGVHCFDWRYRSLKASPRPYYKVRLVRQGRCY
jgi:hypothetical protein